MAQVLAGTLVPMVQAAPIITSIFEVLNGSFCAPPEDPDAPRNPHRDHAFCILCIAQIGAGSVAPGASTLALLWRVAGEQSWGSLPASAPLSSAHFDSKGCRGPPDAA